VAVASNILAAQSSAGCVFAQDCMHVGGGAAFLCLPFLLVYGAAAYLKMRRCITCNCQFRQRLIDQDGCMH
jgi:hypothetical protein